MKLVSIHKHYIIFILMVIIGQPLRAQIKTLDQCIEATMNNNKKLELSRNNILIGKEKQEQVKANRLPKVKIEADYKYFIDLPYQLMPLSVFGGPEGQFKEAQFGVPHNINANLQFAMPLYNPQIKSNIDNTKIGIELAELQLQKSEEQLYFDISNLYYNAQILRNQKQFVEDNLRNSNRILENVRLLHQQAMVKKTDVDKISLQILQLESKLDMIQSQYEQVLNGMKIMMGISLDETFEVEPTIHYQKEVGYSSQSTLDIRIVETKNRLLLGELNTLKKSQLPAVVLYGSYGLTGYGYDQSPNQFLDFYPIGFVGVKATYSLFDGSVTRKKRNQKIREIANNNLQLELLNDQNQLQVNNATLRIGVAMQTIETAQHQIDYAQSIYAQTVLQQKQGVASVTDILLADNAVREAQQSYLSAIIGYMKADLELKKLTGNIKN